MISWNYLHTNPGTDTEPNPVLEMILIPVRDLISYAILALKLYLSKNFMYLDDSCHESPQSDIYSDSGNWLRLHQSSMTDCYIWFLYFAMIIKVINYTDSSNSSMFESQLRS